MENILKVARTKRNLTQEQMSELIGVSRATIISWEKGTHLPSLDDAVRIAEGYRLSMQQVVNHFGLLNND